MKFKTKVLSSYVLAAAADRYLPMFKGKEGEAKPAIDWAIKTLKKQDRIVWFLKNYRKDPEAFDKKNQETLEHFMSIAPHTPAIEKLQFKPDWSLSQGFSALRANETAAHTKLTGDSPRYVNENGKKIIDLGQGWAWWDIEKGWDAEEAAAMGHCGNKPSAVHGDHLLSLRQEKKLAGKTVYEPHLTFILNNGILGEMKGRANEKPKQKYHKYIIDLLKWKGNDDIKIEHIWGGGYEQHNNFEFEDLTKAEQEQLLKLKPDLDIRKLDNIKKKSAKHAAEFHQHNRAIDYAAKVLGRKPEQKDLPKLVEKALTDDENLGALRARIEVAATLVRQIKDQNELKHFAKKTNDNNIPRAVRAAAVERIRDDKFLEKIVKDDAEIAEDAVIRIKDQKILTALWNDWHITDEARLHLLTVSKDPDVIISALAWKDENNHGDEESSIEEDMHNYALHKIKGDPEFIKKVLFERKESFSPTVYGELISLLKEPKVLLAALKKYPRFAGVDIQTAVKRLSIEDLKQGLSEKIENQAFLHECLKRLDDPKSAEILFKSFMPIFHFDSALLAARHAEHPEKLVKEVVDKTAQEDGTCPTWLATKLSVYFEDTNVIPELLKKGLRFKDDNVTAWNMMLTACHDLDALKICVAHMNHIGSDTWTRIDPQWRYEIAKYLMTHDTDYGAEKRQSLIGVLDLDMLETLKKDDLIPDEKEEDGNLRARADRQIRHLREKNSQAV